MVRCCEARRWRCGAPAWWCAATARAAASPQPSCRRGSPQPPLRRANAATRGGGWRAASCVSKCVSWRSGHPPSSVLRGRAGSQGAFGGGAHAQSVARTRCCCRCGVVVCWWVCVCVCVCVRACVRRGARAGVAHADARPGHIRAMGPRRGAASLEYSLAANLNQGSALGLWRTLPRRAAGMCHLTDRQPGEPCHRRDLGTAVCLFFHKNSARERSKAYGPFNRCTRSLTAMRNPSQQCAYMLTYLL